MKLLLRHFGFLRLLALILTALPLLVLPVLGMLWLWQSEYFSTWLIALLACGAAGFVLHFLQMRRDRRTLEQVAEHSRTLANPAWPPVSEDAWAEVEALASRVTIEEYPLNNGSRLLALARHTLETVARHYHGNREQPLLELTVPHTLLIIERASRDLRKEIGEQIPLSHLLTLGSLVRVQRWKQTAGKFETVYRVGRAVLDPSTVLFREFRRSMNNKVLGYGAERVQNWLLREYVRKTGYYAVELYSGKLLLEDEAPSATREQSHEPVAEGEQPESSDVDEPLRILVLGRSNAGKSGLINALFGESVAEADIVAGTTTGVSSFRLQRDDELTVVVTDTPGIESAELKESKLKPLVLQCDLILWVSPATRPDRQQEREKMDEIRAWFAERTTHRPPPVLVAVSHIDQLRPKPEWNPPYDLSPAGKKSSDAGEGSDTAVPGIPQRAQKIDNIRAAVAAVASDLDVVLDNTIPVCLAPERHYNVEDALMAGILANQEEADRVKLLRSLESRRRQEDWTLIRKQLANSGRFLLSNSAKYLKGHNRT